MNCGLRWMTRDGSRLDKDGGRIQIVTGYGWMTGDPSQEMDNGGGMTISLLSNMNVRSYNQVQI